jgi:hypothetical protein
MAERETIHLERIVYATFAVLAVVWLRVVFWAASWYVPMCN